MMTDQGPKVLEYNCRFGDPETQVVLPLVEGDLLEALLAAHDGQRHEVKWRQKNGAAVCVVIASGGYPDKYEKGKPIFGLETPLPHNILIFHAGTRQQGSQIVTEGGRVLGVTALADTLIDAVNAVYSAVGKLTFDGAYYRRDIAAKALIRGNRGR
jgi:phosphoribosylamine--glycine ligase